jgi:hypothetical protein
MPVWEDLIMRRSSALFAICAALPSIAAAQETVPVRFEPGESGAVIEGTISGNGYVAYVLGARDGQRMQVTLEVTGTDGFGIVYFNILPPGDEYAAAYVGSMDDDTEADIVLTEDGDWTIRTYLMGNDRDTGKTVDYTLDVAIGPAN